MKFFGVDLRTLALFRILPGTYLLLDLGIRATDIVAHYTDIGVFPHSAIVDHLSPGAFSLHLINGSMAFQGGLFACAALLAVLLIIGWRTRWVTVLSWLMLVSLANRNTDVLSGQDQLALALMFWAMFLPLGARYSVDSALDTTKPQAPNLHVSVASAALMIQGMLVYFFSAVLKSDAQWVPDGTAVYYALQLDYFATPFTHWFRQFEPVLQGLTYYVRFLELLGPRRCSGQIRRFSG